MLDPAAVGRRLQRHFDEVTEEEFLRRVKRSVTEAEWEEIVRNRVPPRRPGMASRLRRGFRKLLVGFRSKPVSPARSKRALLGDLL